jgi:hypothetical protein
MVEKRTNPCIHMMWTTSGYWSDDQAKVLRKLDAVSILT